MENRILLFRIWDTEKKRMSEPVGIQQPIVKWSDGDVDMPTYFAVAKGEPRFTFMQFTGLTSKNGIDIYEGDVLRNPDNMSYKFADNGVVVYESDCGGFIVKGKYSKHQHHECLSCDVAIDCELIGNIHTTPELLTA